MHERKGMALIHVMHCREIATLFDTDRVAELSLVDRIQVRVHLWTCWHCRQLIRQIKWLKEAARETVIPITENPDLESRLLSKLMLSDH